MLIHGLGATKSSLFDAAAALGRRGLPRPRARPAGLRRLVQARRAVRRAVLRRRRARRDGRARASSARTSSATPWAAAWRSRWGSSTPTASARWCCCARRWPSCGASSHCWSRLLRPEFGMLPHSLRPRASSRPSSGACSPTATRSTPCSATSWSTSSSASTARAARALAFLASARSLYLDKPFGAGGFYPRLSELRAPALFVWGTQRQADPAGFSRHVEQWLPERRADHPRRLRPRAAGGAAGADQRPHPALLRARGRHGRACAPSPSPGPRARAHVPRASGARACGRSATAGSAATGAGKAPARHGVHHHRGEPAGAESCFPPAASGRANACGRSLVAGTMR